MKKTIALATLTILLFSSATALSARDRTADREARRKAVAELRERLREWAGQEIVPKLTEWKGRLDAAMSPEDLNLLNDLRGRAAVLRITARENAVALRTAWREEDYEGVKRYRAQLTGARKELLDILDLVTPLAIEYRSTLETIGKDAAPHIKRWKREGKMIREEWKEEYGEEVADRAWRFPGRRNFPEGMLDPGMRQGWRAPLFMLWDGNGNVDTEEVRTVPGEPSLR